MRSRRATRHAGTVIVLACCFVIGLLAGLGAVERDARPSPAAFAPAEPGDSGPTVAALQDGPSTRDGAARSAADGAELASRPESGLAESPFVPRAAPPGRRSGRDAYYAFLDEGRDQLEALDQRAHEALAEGVPDAERLAFVRARLALGTPGRLDGVLDLVRSKTDPATTKGESLEHALVRFLGDTAEEDPAARDMVRRIAFEEQPIANSVRVRAARAFARSAVGSDLVALRRHLAAETDSRMLASALNGLAENPDADSARSVATELGLTLPVRSEEPEL